MRAPLPPELPLSLSPAALASLLAAFGPPPGSEPRTPLTAVAFARALFESRLPPKFTRSYGAALFFRFATDPGKRALLEAARATGDRRLEDWLTLRPADLAASLCVERLTATGRTRSALDRLLLLAQLRTERDLPERPTYELVAAKPVEQAAALRSLARASPKDRLDLWSHAEADGTLHIALFLRAPAHTTFTFARGSKGIDLAPSAPETFTADLLRLWPDGTRLTLTTAEPDRLERYASLLGFSLRPSFTLKPVHDLDVGALAAVSFPPGVRAASLVAVRWRGPKGERIEARARDPLETARAHAPRGGYVDRVTLRVELEGRTVDVFLQLPHRLEIADRASEAPVRAVLSALRIFEPGALPDDARSLAPYEHPDWRWREVVGDEGFALLCLLKLLVRVELAHVATEEHRMLGASYVVRDIPGGDGAAYALAEDRAYGARLVDRHERVAWKLDRDALARAMRADLGATAPDAGAALNVLGVLDLGVVMLKSGKLRFVYAMAAPPPGWLESLRRACGVGMTPVVFVPRGHAAGLEGVLAIELDVGEQFGVTGIARALGRAAAALGVENEIDLWRTCTEDIVIDAATQRVWVFGQLVALSEKPYRFLEYMAREARVVATKEIGAYVSSSDYPDETARRVKRDLEQQIAAALQGTAVRRTYPLVITEGKKGYRLGWTARVVGQAPRAR